MKLIRNDDFGSIIFEVPCCLISFLWFNPIMTIIEIFCNSLCYPI